MSKIFVWVTLFVTLLYAELPPGWWTHSLSFVLKKDQVQHIEIIERNGGNIHKLAFRWTLYINGGLVMHISYDRRRFQPLLYLVYHRDSFKFDLFPKPKDALYKPLEDPYAVLVFKAFDEKKREAWFDLLMQTFNNSEIYFKQGQ
jgi:hypothetical protein